MLRICAALTVSIACGGAAKPAPTEPAIDNKAGSTTGSAAPRDEHARVVARSAAGGEIEMTEMGGLPFEEATHHMDRHCGAKRYTIGEIQRRDTGRQVMSDGTQVPEQVYRMRYRCVVAP